jgi:heme A synthase
LAVSGAGTVAFALGALRPALARGDHRSLAPWLIACSLPAVDNLSDVFFRLDCRAADAGCTMSRAAASWHGTVHVAVFFVAVVPTLAAPFVLARALRRTDGWRELAGAAQVFGVLTVVGLAAAIALSDTAVAGLAQRVIAAIVASGIAALAWQTARRAAATTPSPVRGGGEIPSTARNLAPTS